MTKIYKKCSVIPEKNLGGDSARQDKQILQRNTSSQSTSYVKNTERHTESLFIILKVMKKWK